MKKIVLLGSTGSVGRNVIDVVRSYPERFRIRAISSNENTTLLAEQAEAVKPEVVAIGSKDLYPDLKEKIRGETKILAGEDALREIAGDEMADIVVIAISGTAALMPLVSALEADRTVALASKEPVVSAGKIISDIVKRGAGRILPVDSEHSALLQCLAGRDSKEVENLYITGSGGPLKDRREEEFDSLSIDEILSHPKWNMGKKITVDSATMMNKGLEVIEARWLFDMPPDKIKVVIHPEAIIHSMVEFIDGTVSASLFCPDMRFPILKALAYPEIVPSDFPRIDFSSIGNLSFSELDAGRFPAYEMALEALRTGGTMPAVLNSSNEVAVKLFLEGKIKFTHIVKKIRQAVDKHKINMDPSLEDIIEAERWALKEVLESC